MSVFDVLIHSQEYQGRQVVGYMSEGSQRRLEALIDEYDVESVIEVGSYLGLSACFFAERVPSVTCVDMFDLNEAKTMNPVGIHLVDDQYRTFLANTVAYPHIRSIRLPSQHAATLDLEADLVYIDAGHTFSEVAADIEAWRPHARKVLCGDDYGDERFEVTEAVQAAGIPDRGERVWWTEV